MSSETQSMEKILNARLEVMQQERSAIKESLDSLDVKMKSCIAKIGTKPRETDEEMAKEMKDLEHKHATTTQTNADERQFMRTMDQLRQRRKQLTAYIKAQEEIDAIKTRRGILAQELREKDKTIDELYVGIRKVKMASKLGCSTSDIVEKRFTVPEDRLARIIGKGGSNLRQVEEECRVSIDTDRTGGGLRLVGTEESIATGFAAITVIVNTVTEEISPPDETIVCMIWNKAAMVQEIQTRWNVRLDVSRAKRLCKIIGLSDAIQGVKDEINSIHSARTELTIEAGILGYIVGKGGSTVRALEEQNRVQIDISREANTIVVLGFRPDVESVTGTLRSIIEENREVEEVLKLKRNVILGCVVGQGGSIARNLQKELNVNIRADRNEEGGAEDSLTIKGNMARVIAAKQHILTLAQTFEAQTAELEVPSECVPLIVGKKGAKIKSMRDEYPDVTIDIEETTVLVRSASEPSRAAVVAAIQAVVDANYLHTVPLDSDITIQLKTKRGDECRTLLTTELGLNLDIDTEGQAVKLRGYRANVEKGIQALADFQANNYTEELSCDEEDLLALANGTTNPVDSAQEDYQVEVYVGRKEGIIRVRGLEANVKAWISAMTSLLGGDAAHGSVLLPVDPVAYSALIGKGGSNVKKLETENGVRLDFLKKRNLVRIRLARESAAAAGTAPAPEGAAVDAGANLSAEKKLEKAKAAVVAFVEDIKISTTIDLPLATAAARSAAAAAPLDEAAVFANIKTLFGVEVSRGTGEKPSRADKADKGDKGDKEEDKGEKEEKGENEKEKGKEKGEKTKERSESDLGKVTLRGTIRLVEEAKRHLRELWSGHARFCLELSAAQLVSLSPSSGAFAKIQGKHGVKLTLESPGDASGAVVHGIVISGTLDAVGKARLDVVRMLDALFPSEFLSVAMPPPCLLEVGAPHRLAEVTAATGACLQVDPVYSCVRARGAPTAVLAAVEAIRAKMTAWMQLHSFVAIEEFMIPILLAKNASALVALEKESGASITLNRGSMRLDIEGSDQGKVAAAVQAIMAKIETIRSEYWETTVESELIGPFIGKQGSNIAKLKGETSVNIDIDTKTGLLKVSGDSSAVAAVKERVQAFLLTERQNSFVLEVYIPLAAFPIVIGSKGATIREVQQSCGCRVDLDRNKQAVVLKGSSENCQKARKNIEEILDREGFAVTQKPMPVLVQQQPEPQQPETAAQPDESKGPRKIPGAAPNMQGRLATDAGKPMSKSALRRMRRRANQAAEEEEEEEEEEVPVAAAAAAVAVVPPTKQAAGGAAGAGASASFMANGSSHSNNGHSAVAAGAVAPAPGLSISSGSAASGAPSYGYPGIRLAGTNIPAGAIPAAAPGLSAPVKAPQAPAINTVLPAGKVAVATGTAAVAATAAAAANAPPAPPAAAYYKSKTGLSVRL